MPTTQPITPLTCPFCNVTIPKWTRGDHGQWLPSFVVLFNHIVNDHPEDTDIDRGQFEDEIKRAEKILNPAPPEPKAHVDQQQLMVELLEAHRDLEAELRGRPSLPWKSHA